MARIEDQCEELLKKTKFKSCGARQICSAGERWWQIIDLVTDQVRGVVYSEEDSNYLWQGPVYMTGIIKEIRNLREENAKLKEKLACH